MGAQGERSFASSPRLPAESWEAVEDHLEARVVDGMEVTGSLEARPPSWQCLPHPRQPEQDGVMVVPEQFGPWPPNQAPAIHQPRLADECF